MAENRPIPPSTRMVGKSGFSGSRYLSSGSFNRSSSGSKHDRRTSVRKSIDLDDVVSLENEMQQEEAWDKDLLERTVEDAGQFAYGVKMVEVWVWNESLQRLHRPEGGFWLCPYYHNETSQVYNFCRLIDKNLPDYVAPALLPPGVGIAGALWSEVAHYERADTIGASGKLFSKFFNSARIAWRDVKALAADPDQPYNPRLQLLAQTNVRWAGAVSFRIGTESGIVVYYARENCHYSKLQSMTNVEYLIQASDFIGSAYALRRPRIAALAVRRLRVKNNFRMLRTKLLEYARKEGTLEALIQPSAVKLEPDFKQPEMLIGEQTLRFFSHSRVTLASMLRKCKGGGAHPPPTFSWVQTTWTFVGVFLSICMLCVTNIAFEDAFGSDYIVPLGPMGALLGLQYGLTAAPAAQPRTIIVGQVVSCLIGVAMTEATQLKVWMRQSLALALSIALMTKISVVNPPAAANAFLFAGPSYNLSNIVPVVITSMMAICSGMLINNLAQKRQYPTYWGFVSFWEAPIDYVRGLGQAGKEAIEARWSTREAQRIVQKKEKLEKGKGRLEFEQERMHLTEADLLEKNRGIGGRPNNYALDKLHIRQSVGTITTSETQIPEEFSNESQKYRLIDQRDLEAASIISDIHDKRFS